MPAQRTRTITSPLKGVHKSAAFQQQPPFTAYAASDMWPTDAKTGRDRLAVRPGWASYGSQNSVNLIATLNVAPSESYKRLLITATGGELFKWSGETPTSLATGVVDTGRNVQTAPYLQELFLANATVAEKVYSYSGGTVSNWTATTDGSLPTDNLLICEWANRIVLAGAAANPHLWYMSRIGDPYSWLFAEDDTGSAVAATNLAGGQIGEPITSLIPHNLECIIFGSANSLHVLRGNPSSGGYMERISHVVGPVNGTAWCKTADDWTYMLTRDGLYRMRPGCGDIPEQVSRSIIPQSLLNVNGVTTTAYLCYDVLFRGIHIYLTGVTDEYWWFDLKHESFWPVTVPGVTIRAIGRHDPIETATKSGVLVGTSTGLKRLDVDTDLGGSDEAYVKIGPFPLESRLGKKGQVLKATVKFGANTTDTTGTVDFYAAEDAESVVALPTSRKKSVTIDQLQNNHGNCYPRISGNAGMIVITQGSTSEHLSFEGATLYEARKGEERG